ncbi:hypothetical protein DFH09DRAFT_1495082 [Mycena vulgaris]|nr:hypothetical protein DFH09DRAFT_1495082 [Mycena vulgaris]
MARITLAGGSPRAAEPRSDSLDATQHVVVLHPGYTPPRTLFLLAAFPAPSGQHGIPFSVVSDACRILAANKDGTLCDSHNTAVTAPVDGDHLVPPGEYTYYVPGEPRCPVCASFRAWTPPRAVPAHWAFSGMGAQEGAPHSSPSTCSGVVRAADGRAEEKWVRPGSPFDPLGLLGHERHNAQPPRHPLPPNCLATHADLTGDGLDQGHFVFAPYARTAVCVCLTSAVADFAAKYHLRAVTIPGRIHPLNVYVRFAWGTFHASQTLLAEFSQASGSVTMEMPTELAGEKRGTKRKHNEDGADDDGGDGPTGTNDSQETSDTDAASDSPREPPLDVCTLSKRDLEAAERLDADLECRPVAPYEEAAGIYRGYSRSLRAIFEYRQAHHEVSAVRTARMARVGEDVDEQLV